MDTTTMSNLTDENRLTGAKSRFGYNIPTYDDGYGKVYILRDSMGIQGIVRARSWEDAFEICEDEFFPEATETIEEIEKEYGKEFFDHACFQEAFGFRPNGARTQDTIKHGIYARDLNGEHLDVLTPSLLAELEITLEIEND